MHKVKMTVEQINKLRELAAQVSISDLHAAPGVLDYIVAAHPAVVLELIEQRDRAWHALEQLQRKIDAAFTEAEALRLGREV